MKVLKALYGLRQSGAEFHHMLTDVLNKAGFFSPVGDPCLYRQDYPDEGIVLVATYVDDLTICATTVALKDKFLTFLRQHFEIGDSEGGPIDASPLSKTSLLAPSAYPWRPPLSNLVLAS